MKRGKSFGSRKTRTRFSGSCNSLIADPRGLIKVDWDSEDDVRFIIPENFNFQPRTLSKEERLENGGRFAQSFGLIG